MYLLHDTQWESGRERALRLVAEMMIGEYPIAYEISQNDIYVDDCIETDGSRTGKSD